MSVCAKRNKVVAAVCSELNLKVNRKFVKRVGGQRPNVILTIMRDVEVDNKLFESKVTFYRRKPETKGHVIGML